MKKVKENLLGFILGAIIFGGLGVVIAEYALKASQVEFKNGKSVQAAIEDLYDKSSKLQTITIKDNVANQNYDKQMILTPENDSLVGIVYFNPANLNEACGPGNVKVNLDKTGCMKWYVYDKSDTSYGLLLDHNIYWGDYSSTLEEKEKLTSTEESGSSWKVTPELISGIDIARITKKQGWDKTDGNTWYFLDTLTNTPDSNKGLGTSKYYWLFDYTEGCTKYGCRINYPKIDNDTHYYNYWTSDCISDDCSIVWSIDNAAVIMHYGANSTDNGLRPVITIKK